MPSDTEWNKSSSLKSAQKKNWGTPEQRVARSPENFTFRRGPLHSDFTLGSRGLGFLSDPSKCDKFGEWVRSIFRISTPHTMQTKSFDKCNSRGKFGMNSHGGEVHGEGAEEDKGRDNEEEEAAAVSLRSLRVRVVSLRRSYFGCNERKPA